MLQSIESYVKRYTNVIATVTGIDIEVVNANLLRVAGTGMYAAKVGESITNAGQVYTHVLRNRVTVYMENPRENTLCAGCHNLPYCRETLSLCTPIVLGDAILGVIGLVCFDTQERDRVIAQKDVFIDFVQQIAEVISRAVQDQAKARRVAQLLDTFLRIVDVNHRGVLAFNTKGAIVYCNEMARLDLNLEDGGPFPPVSLRRTGDTISSMDEFEITLDGQSTRLLGSISTLESQDPEFDQVLIFDSLARFTERFAVTAASAESGLGVSSIVGKSRAVLRVKNKILQIAHTSSTVLITGESGTGKEMMARAIHAESERRDKPFVAVNCGAIPDALLESELFGYVRGAFTGANPSGRMGKFELAQNGVIFLDEIGAMPLYLQVKLLRALQEKCITRLGSNRSVDVDVRIIAATNDDLVDLMRQNMFRDDLYYRLNVIPLEVPPLRERCEDIPVLAEFFLRKYSRLFSKSTPLLDKAMLDVLAAYAWPRNVREFENIMEYLVNITPTGGKVSLSMLPLRLREKRPLTTPVQSVPKEHGDAGGTLIGTALPAADKEVQFTPQTLAELEREAIHAALRFFGTHTHGKQKAAEALGIGVATLYRKLNANSL